MGGTRLQSSSMRGGAYALRLVALLLCMTLCGHRAAAQLLHDDGSNDTDTLVRSWREVSVHGVRVLRRAL